MSCHWVSHDVQTDGARVDIRCLDLKVDDGLFSGRSVYVQHLHAYSNEDGSDPKRELLLVVLVLFVRRMGLRVRSRGFESEEEKISVEEQRSTSEEEEERTEEDY